MSEQQKHDALAEALEMMNFGVEPKSALKEAASARGVPFGEQMGAFVDWALEQMK